MYWTIITTEAQNLLLVSALHGCHPKGAFTTVCGAFTILLLRVPCVV